MLGIIKWMFTPLPDDMSSTLRYVKQIERRMDPHPLDGELGPVKEGFAIDFTQDGHVRLDNVEIGPIDVRKWNRR